MIHLIHSFQPSERRPTDQEEDVLAEPSHSSLRFDGSGIDCEKLWCTGSRRDLEQIQLRDLRAINSKHDSRKCQEQDA